MLYRLLFVSPAVCPGNSQVPHRCCQTRSELSILFVRYCAFSAAVRNEFTGTALMLPNLVQTFNMICPLLCFITYCLSGVSGTAHRLSVLVRTFERFFHCCALMMTKHIPLVGCRPTSWPLRSAIYMYTHKYIYFLIGLYCHPMPQRLQRHPFGIFLRGPGQGPGPTEVGGVCT